MTEQTYAPGEIRDRLANERTLLAWLRTAIALIGSGLAFAKAAVSLSGESGVKAPASPDNDRSRRKPCPRYR